MLAKSVFDYSLIKANWKNKISENMKTVAFHGIDFELTSIKQSMLNKQGPTQKIHVIND